MKPGRLLFFLLFSVSVFAQHKDKFSVGYNKSIESYFLAELLAVEYRKTNTSFEEYKKKECRKYQPLIEEILDKHSYLKKFRIAKLTAELNDTLVSYGMAMIC